jgi:hypothetical protein
MNLLETLKQLKAIQPDPTFSENSRRSILAFIPTEPISSRRILVRFLAATGSFVLAGALIFIIAGGLSTTNLAPQFSSIDPTALHAEAQAIDTQIELLNVSYTESAASTEPVPMVKISHPIVISGTSSTLAVITASSTPTSTISVDEILQGLSQ